MFDATELLANALGMYLGVHSALGLPAEWLTLALLWAVVSVYLFPWVVGMAFIGLAAYYHGFFQAAGASSFEWLSTKVSWRTRRAVVYTLRPLRQRRRKAKRDPDQPRLFD